MITLKEFRTVFPRAKESGDIVEAFEKLAKKYEITTDKRAAAFLAQCGHESAGFSAREENLYYSASALNRVFAKYFKNAGRDAKAYAKQPEKIANVVYANRIGNGDTESGDGYRFRGRGYIQLTGRENYESFADFKGMSISEVIDYLETVEGALESAFWYWDTRKLNSYADRGDIRGMTKRINGGTNGLKDRQEHYEKILAVLQGGNDSRPSEAAPTASTTLSMGDKGKDVELLQKILGLTVDGYFGPKTKRRVKQFQRENRLVADGIVGPNTWATLAKLNK